MLELLDVCTEVSLNLSPDRKELAHLHTIFGLRLKGIFITDLSDGILDSPVLIFEAPLYKVLRYVVGIFASEANFFCTCMAEDCAVENALLAVLTSFSWLITICSMTKLLNEIAMAALKGHHNIKAG